MRIDGIDQSIIQSRHCFALLLSILLVQSDNSTGWMVKLSVVLELSALTAAFADQDCDPIALRRLHQRHPSPRPPPRRIDIDFHHANYGAGLLARQRF